MPSDLGRGGGGPCGWWSPQPWEEHLHPHGLPVLSCGKWECSSRGCSAAPPAPVDQRATSLLPGWSLVGLFWGWAVLGSGWLHRGVFWDRVRKDDRAGEGSGAQGRKGIWGSGAGLELSAGTGHEQIPLAELVTPGTNNAGGCWVQPLSRWGLPAWLDLLCGSGGATVGQRWQCSPLLIPTASPGPEPLSPALPWWDVALNCHPGVMWP